MITSPNIAALNGIQAVNQKAESAYEDIEEAARPDDEIGNDSDDLVQAVSSLSEIETEFSASVKAFKAGQESTALLMEALIENPKGSIYDTTA